MNLNLFTF